MKKRISLILALTMVLSMFSIVANAAVTEDVYFDISYTATDGTAINVSDLEKGDTFFAVVSLVGEYDKLAGAMVALKWNNDVIQTVKSDWAAAATTFKQSTTSRLDGVSTLVYTYQEENDDGDMVDASIPAFTDGGNAFANGSIYYAVATNTDVIMKGGPSAFAIGANPIMKIRFMVVGTGDANLLADTSKTIKIGVFDGETKKEYVQSDSVDIVNIPTITIGDGSTLVDPEATVSTQQSVDGTRRGFLASCTVESGVHNPITGLKLTFTDGDKALVTEGANVKTFPFGTTLEAGTAMFAVNVDNVPKTSALSATATIVK